MPTPNWAPPRTNLKIDDCAFYHTMDIPGHGIVQAEWDLRGRERDYLGHTEVAGKSVLEIGTASGHMCFTMEKMGAQVVAFDLSENEDWDLVPYANTYPTPPHILDRKSFIQKMNNGYWLAHQAFQSKAKVLYGSVYKLPDDIGQFDICTIGSILMHLRDPFLALERAAAHAKDTIIITEQASGRKGELLHWLASAMGLRTLLFVPDRNNNQRTTWWRFSPSILSEFLHILGFQKTSVSYHNQKWHNHEFQCFTVVGHRNT